MINDLEDRVSFVERQLGEPDSLTLPALSMLIGRIVARRISEMGANDDSAITGLDLNCLLMIAACGAELDKLKKSRN